MISLTQVSAPTILGEDSTASGASPSLLLEDTTASAKDLRIIVDGDKANFREEAGAAGSLLLLDLANNRVGVGLASPLKPLHVAGSSGSTGFSVTQPGDGLVVDNATNSSINIISAATSTASLYMSTTGKSGRGAINFNFNTDKLELAAAGAMLTLPVTGNLLSTNNFEVSNTAPSIILTDTTASAKDLTIEVDADFARLRESAGAAGSLLTLDLTNNRVGIATASPGVALDVTGAVTASGAVTAGSLAVGAGTSLSTIAYSTYSPTFTSVANLDSTPVTVGTFRYIRHGAFVQVYGMFQIDATTTLTLTNFGISLPIASNLGAAQDALGTVAAATDARGFGTVSGDTTNDRFDVNITPVGVGATTYTFVGYYTII